MHTDRTKRGTAALALTLISICLLSSAARADSPGSGSLTPPLKLHWCAVFCSSWVWYHNHYVGAGTEATSKPECGMTVERFTRESVIMHRTDCGQTPGKATLTGRISDDGSSIANGTITWTWHPCCGTGTGVFQSTWGELIDAIPGSGAAPRSYSIPFRAPGSPQLALASVTQAQASSQGPPSAAPPTGPRTWPPAGETLDSPTAQGTPLVTTVPLSVKSCDMESSTCTVWTWTGYDYAADAGTPTQFRVSLDQWNGTRVRLHQAHIGRVGFNYLYSGKLQEDGSVRGDMAVYPPGIDLDTDSKAPTVSKSEWLLTVLHAATLPAARCDIHDPANAYIADARQRAETAFKAGDIVAAVCWSHVGALQGVVFSQSTYGYNLRVGRGAAQDFPEAFRWSERAAKQGQYEAMLNVADMYQNGTGVAPDAKQAAYWHDEAHFKEQLGQLSRATPDTMMMGLIQGYFEKTPGILDRDHLECQQSAHEGKPQTPHCLDVETRYQAGVEAARQHAFDECLRKNPREPSLCHR